MMKIIVGIVFLFFISFCENHKEKELKNAKRELLLCSLVSNMINKGNSDLTVGTIIYCTLKGGEKIDKANSEDHVVPGLF